VTVTASNYGGVGEVVETLVGYEYVRNSSSLSGVDEDGSTLSFILAGEQSFTYSVTVPEVGVEHSITGVVKDILGGTESPVGGSSSVMAETGVAPSGPMATRSFSPATAPVGSPVRVTITAADYGGVGEVVETLVGYTYVPESSTLSGVEESEDGATLSFVLAGEGSFSYEVIVGVGEVVETLVGYTYVPESSTLPREWSTRSPGW
jgi:hypothetical protein